MIGIYKITNNINNKVYIGQSINIERRWRDHRKRCFYPKATQYSSPLYKAFRKYGLQNFSFEVIEECLEADLNDRECFYIQLYNANNTEKGYNLTAGGQNSNPKNKKLNADDIKNIYTLLLTTSLSEQEIANRFDVSQRTISGINLGETNILIGYTYPLRQNIKSINYCLDCGKKIGKKSCRCIACSNRYKQSKNDKPDRETLKREIREKTFVELGKKYSVSDKAIVKWCVFYNLPCRKKDIKSYSDIEWSKI